jgi:hypothetical protein
LQWKLLLLVALNAANDFARAAVVALWSERLTPLWPFADEEVAPRLQVKRM